MIAIARILVFWGIPLRVMQKTVLLDNWPQLTEPLKGHGEKKNLETFYVRT